MSVTTVTQYNGKLSIHTQRTLKKIQHRSYYRAMNFLSFIPNRIERNFLIQTLNSVSAYLQNNYDVNIVTIWIENVSIQKQVIPNYLINFYQKNLNMKISYFILIEVGIKTKFMKEN
jgi:hypothetical protein